MKKNQEVWGKRLGLDIGQTYYLLKLERAAVRAQVRVCNENNAPSAHPQMEEFEAYAKILGLETDWSSGLHPTLKNIIGYTYYMPED